MHDTVSIMDRYDELKAVEPAIRARDAADRLGISEGELVAARENGREIRPLALQKADFAALIEGLREVGPVMTLTRNEAAVHETHGTVGEFSGQGTIGQVVGAIDLRLFFTHWHAGFAVTEEVRSGVRSSFQIFDGGGTSILKVYAVDGTDQAAWDRLRNRYASSGEMRPSFAPLAPPAQDRPDAEVDREALRTGWLALEHTHDFYRLLRTTGVGREQALRLAGEDLARPVATDSVNTVLEAAATDEIPIMCFVGSRGCVQIYSGPVHRIVPMGPWLNVLDPRFNLHLRTDRVASGWVVTKPTKLRGPITSLELFDSEGTLVCQFFGARAPGETEREDWRSLLANLPGRAG